MLKTHASQIVKGEAGERDDGSAVESGFIKAIHQMDGARARRADTDAQPPGMLGEARRHERGRFLVAYADIADAVLALTQGFDDRIDAVTDNTEDMGRAPIDQSFDQNVGSVQLIARGFGAGCAVIASSVSEGAAARGLTEVSVARAAIAVPRTKSRRKNLIVLISLISFLRSAD